MAHFCIYRIKFATGFVLLTIFAVLAQNDSLIAAAPFSKSTLKIISHSGAHSFSVELALTPAQRAQGLQYRQSLPAGTGMLFDFKTTQQVTMWMKNTYISLDMMFIAADGTIANIAKATQPQSLNYISSAGPVRGVLEVQAGTASVLGIKKGDRIIHDIFGHDIFGVEN
jgi:uncharacterized protein